jgi:hypothetical protein
MSGSRVDESGEAERRVGDVGGSERGSKRIGVRESGRVEADNLGGSTRKVNAVLSLCGGVRTA